MYRIYVDVDIVTEVTRSALIYIQLFVNITLMEYTYINIVFGINMLINTIEVFFNTKH